MAEFTSTRDPDFGFVCEKLQQYIDRQFLYKLKQTRKVYDSRTKNLKRKGAEQKLQEFLHKPSDQFKVCFPGQILLVQPLPSSDSPQESSCYNKISPQFDPLTRRLGSTNNQLASLRRQVQEEQRANKCSSDKIGVLTEERKELLCKFDISTTINAVLSNQLQQKKQTTLQLQKTCSTLQARTKGNQNLLTALKKENVTRQLKRKSDRLVAMTCRLENAMRKISRLRREARAAKTSHCYSQRICRVQRASLREKTAKIKELEEENIILRANAEPLHVLLLKDPDTGYFTRETVKCVIELIGEKEVSATRCAEVIETVCKHLLDIHLPQTELPSLRSVLRFADKGHIISKFQLADAVLNSEHFDIHTDGTTKCGKKVVGQQVTLDSGASLACGFSVIATEDTSSLMEITTNLLQELTDVCQKEGEEAEKLFKMFFTKLTATMSDRAAVNKAFNKELNTMRKATIGTEEDLDFLHCNAHVLLGLANAANKTLKNVFCSAVGREKNPKFSNNRNKENSVWRLIRETCTVVGPRGDERYSCRDAWLAYCSLQGFNSSIPGFKGNRFNMLFRAAAAIHFHQSDLADFLANYKTEKNWKQDGILHDITCDDIDAALVALGIIFFRVTQPYWQLLGRPIAYLDFYQYVVLLRSFLKIWSVQPTDAFTKDFEPLFNIPVAEDKIFLSLINTSREIQERASSIICHLCAGFLEVVERQLADFLPDKPGKYHAVQDEEQRQKLAHCQLTNMFGEQCFGDLDFSLFKRRNASSHHLSTLNMLNRNKTVSSFLSSLTEEEENFLFKKSACLAQTFRAKHRQEEKNAVERKRHQLEEKRAKKDVALVKKRAQVTAILAALKNHDGPCRTAADVGRVLQYFTKQRTGRLGAIKAELQYHRVILQLKSPLLKTSLPFNLMVENLKEFLKTATNEKADEEREEQPEEEHQDAPDMPCLRECESFKFARTGITVGVLYDSDYYIGEVTAVQTEAVGTVNFLERCMIRDDAYRWPDIPDEADVNAEYVFISDFELGSANGRVWMVKHPNILKDRLLAFQQNLDNF
ncbi:hypothetical protein ACJMK2_012053 [Sinanodonta woodiana]|uniref:Uncharacterized protein n=1 Tax=Sinanodonta woodiana TaxID=1069815 RepID=A0ABD3V9A6_SINWO